MKGFSVVKGCVGDEENLQHGLFAIGELLKD